MEITIKLDPSFVNDAINNNDASEWTEIEKRNLILNLISDALDDKCINVISTK